MMFANEKTLAMPVLARPAIALLTQSVITARIRMPMPRNSYNARRAPMNRIKWREEAAEASESRPSSSKCFNAVTCFDRELQLEIASNSRVTLYYPDFEAKLFDATVTAWYEAALRHANIGVLPVKAATPSPARLRAVC